MWKLSIHKRYKSKGLQTGPFLLTWLQRSNKNCYCSHLSVSCISNFIVIYWIYETLITDTNIILFITICPVYVSISKFTKVWMHLRVPIQPWLFIIMYWSRQYDFNLQTLSQSDPALNRTHDRTIINRKRIVKRPRCQLRHSYW